MAVSRFFGKKKNNRNNNEPASEQLEGSIPRHVAVIMDGNNRWAKKNLAPGMSGHNVGAESIRKVLKVCQQKKIEALTLFAFSSENWNRPAEEVRELMSLLKRYLKNEVDDLHKQGVRLCFIGRRDRLEPDIVASMQSAEVLTESNSGSTLVLAIDYGGQWDVGQAAQKIAIEVARGNIDVQTVDEFLVAQYMSLSDLPALDLCIRTGAEQRISNFLLWDIAYAELYFTEYFWPDFNEQAFEQALLEYSSRQRRFGQTSEQVDVNSSIGIKR